MPSGVRRGGSGEFALRLRSLLRLCWRWVQRAHEQWLHGTTL